MQCCHGVILHLNAKQNTPYKTEPLSDISVPVFRNGLDGVTENEASYAFKTSCFNTSSAFWIYGFCMILRVDRDYFLKQY
jgi:hypothetical protein